MTIKYVVPPTYLLKYVYLSRQDVYLVWRGGVSAQLMGFMTLTAD